MPTRLLAVLALLLAPAMSMAIVVPSYGPYSNSIASSLTDWPAGTTLSFPQFNHPGYTLLAVRLDLNAAMDSVLTVTNSAATPSAGTVQTLLMLAVQDAGGWLTPVNPNPPQNQPAPQYLPQITMLTNPANYSLNVNESTTTGHMTQTGTGGGFYTDQNILNEFTGSGNIVLNAYTFTQTLLANTGGNTAADQVTMCDLTGQVTYFYETPEPATLALMGVAGLLIRRRRTA